MKILKLLIFMIAPAVIYSEENLRARSQSRSHRLEGKQAWYSDAQSRLYYELLRQRNTNLAFNVIIFVGDGMGMSTVTASRIYKGQLEGNAGEENYHSFEHFQDVGLIKTYSVNMQVTDSAAAATAMLTGVKTYQSVIGMDVTAPSNPCESKRLEEAKVDSLFKWAQDVGMKTGVVTTTRITHATPAAAYAHTPRRSWECDSYIPQEYQSCTKDIARQLVEDAPGKNMNVVFGGGLCEFRSCRSDGKDLIWNWKQRANAENISSSFVENKEQMDQLQEEERVLGLFDQNHMSYDLERDDSSTGQPSLAEMTTKAISLLQNGNNGFLLLVEGGRIDHAHHGNYAKLALTETIQFDEAVRAALTMTNSEETLVIVTADHSHTMTINGYPDRGNDILGLDKLSGHATETLTYANGPGYKTHRKNSNSKEGGYPWNDPLDMSFRDENRYRHFAPIYKGSESHGGEDVAIYANGPFSHLFSGVFEQNYIAHAISCAAKLGPSAGFCHSLD